MNGDKIYYNIWDGGMCNQIMSFEIAAILNILLQKDIIIPIKESKISNYKTYQPGIEEKLHCLALFDVPFDYEYEMTSQDETLPLLFDHGDNLQGCILSFGDVKNTDHFEEFSDGKNIIYMDKYINDGISYRNATSGYLSNYETLLYLESPILKTLVIEQMKKIILKQEYIDLKNEVISWIGEYNGLHLRLSDHEQTGMGLIPADELISRIKTTFSSDIPLLISTCSPNDHRLQILKKEFPNIIVLDDLFDNFKDKFNQVHYGNTALLRGAISVDILADSKLFMGKFYSTFSGRVNQLRFYKDPNTQLYFFRNNKDLRHFLEVDTFGMPIERHPNKHYSWNRYNLNLYHPNALTFSSRYQEVATLTPQ